MPQSSSAKKLLTACGLLAALFAVSTPFWLFTSEQSVTAVNKTKHTSPSTSASASDATSQDTKSTDSKSSTASTDKASATADAKAKDASKSDAKSDTKSKDSKSSDTKSKDAKAAEDKGDAKAADSKASEKGVDKSEDKSAKPETKDNKADPKAKAEDKSKSDDKAKDDGKANAEVKDKAESKDTKADASKSDDAKATAKDDPKAKDEASKDAKAKGDSKESESKDAKAIADAKKSAAGQDKFKTAAVEKDNLAESTLKPGESIAQKPMSLADKVRDITEKRTEADKAAYERSIKEREQQVDDAIASIAGNYKIYLPNLLSEKAVVIYFSAPVSSTKINLRKDADLSKLKIDSLSGATRVKYQDQDTFEDVSESAMDYIANALSKESGAELYKVATVTTYPDNVAKLYSMSFVELNENKYPELTDDEPLIIDDYAVIYLCYPNWWGNMPGAIYSFLAKYDLSDKIIVPVCLYEKDKFSNTLESIATIEPNASVHSNGLLISKDDCSNETKLRNKIRLYLTELSKDFE